MSTIDTCWLLALIAFVGRGGATADAGARAVVAEAGTGEDAALPVVVVTPDPDGAVQASIVGTEATYGSPAPPEAGPAGQMLRGAEIARDEVSDITAILLWPGRMTWVGPETVTSLIETHGVEPGSMLRPGWRGETGWPVLLPMSALDHLRAVSPERMPPDVIEDIAGYVPTRVVDVGGGTGRLLTAVLEQAPASTGVLFELPHVIADAGDAASDRLRLVAGDFLADPLPAAEAYILMEVLHDWSDDDATRILTAVRRAAAPGARLIIVEVLVPDSPGPDHSKVLDIMMLAVTGGRERTRGQYETLLTETGFELRRVMPTHSSYFIVEATAV